MKGLILGLVLVLAFGSVEAMAAARKGETIKVQINKQKRTAKTGFTVRFIELVEDSRCPIDTNCIWAGNAKIKVRVTRNGQSHVLTLDTHGSGQYGRADGYSIKLTDLTPHPRSNIRIDRNGYVATIEVSKLSR